MKQKVRKFFKELLFYTGVVIVSLIFTICLRVFVVAPIIKIPSGSMEPAVLAGDYIIVSKQIPGPRVYKDIRQIKIDGKVQIKPKSHRRIFCRNLDTFGLPVSVVEKIFSLSDSYTINVIFASFFVEKLML